MANDLGWSLTEDDRQLFLAEADELVQVLESGALAMEQGGIADETLQAMFRAAHTLKGNAGLMGEQGLADHMHHLEARLDDLRSGRVALTPAMIQAVLSGIDTMRDLLAAFARGESPAAPEAPAEAEVAAAAAAPAVEGDLAVPASAAAAGGPRYRIRLDVSPDCPMPAVRVFQAYQALSRVGRIETSQPAQESLAQFQGYTADLLLAIESAGAGSATEQIAEALEGVDDIALARAEEEKPQQAAPSANGSGANGGGDSLEQAGAQTVRVRVDLLDHLMNLVGELVLDRTRVADLIGHLEGTREGKDQDQEEIRNELSRTSVHLGRVTLDLQESIMKARMLPIEHLFRRYPRLVRDLGQKAGKKVQFEMTGLDTELDRMVMDELGDPLTHLLRNAVDHGIESAEARRASGKPETGRVRLHAGTEEGYIVIELTDDGGGIDVQRVKEVALQRGVITQEQAEQLTEREAEELIFAPGFSTAKEVTEISGRGVGLDAVRSSLERLSGLIEIVSQRGEGTTFRLRIPLTLAIMRALLVRTGEEIYALPLSSVRQIVKLTGANVQQTYGRSLLADRGQLIPLQGLSKLYGGNEREEETFAVVVGSGRQQVALRVEALLGEQEIVLKSFGDFLGAVPGLTGATILGDGQLALVTDVRFFLQGKDAS